MAPFYGWCSTASRLQPLRGGSLLFTILLFYASFSDRPIFKKNQFISKEGGGIYLTWSFNRSFTIIILSEGERYIPRYLIAQYLE